MVACCHLLNNEGGCKMHDGRKFFCPNPDCGKEVCIVNRDYFCFHCGTQLSLPENLADLSEQDEDDYLHGHQNDPEESHRHQKTVGKYEYCYSCGKKL